jgi:PAS domain S-box-containing protein
MTTEPTPHDIIDGLAALVCGLDAAGAILMFNRPCEELTGLSRDAALGLRWLDLFAIGERHGNVLALWHQARAGQQSAPFEALCRNGRSIRWRFTRWERPRPASLALWALGIDITEDREALVRARQLERMVALGNLVAGLAHELRNPLNGAMLQLVVAERHVARSNAPALAPATQAIAHATAEIRRLSALLDDFLLFARPLPVELQRVDVRTLVDLAVDRAAPKAQPAGVAISLAPGAPAVAEVDPSRVEGAIYHLLANAVEAAARAADREVRVAIELRGNTIAIEVADHGAGLPAEDAPIFDPFFTTKENSTGLGLAIVERVATDHGGAITYARHDGTTRFRLELPIVAGLAS